MTGLDFVFLPMAISVVISAKPKVSARIIYIKINTTIINEHTGQESELGSTEAKRLKVTAFLTAAF